MVLQLFRKMTLYKRKKIEEIKRYEQENEEIVIENAEVLRNKVCSKTPYKPASYYK